MSGLSLVKRLNAPAGIIIASHRDMFWLTETHMTQFLTRPTVTAKVTAKVITTLMATLMATAATAQTLSDVDDPLYKALVGKSFVGETGMAIKLEEDGTISGGKDDIKFGGTWSVRDGKYCRTLEAPTPEAMRSTGCPDLKVEGDKAIITIRPGTTRTYMLK